MTNRAWVLGVLLSGCVDVVTAPAPPQHDGPFLAVTSAPVPIGTLELRLTSDTQRLVGTLELPRAVPLAHPVRLAVGWMAGVTAQTFIPGEVYTLAAMLDGRAGAQGFDVPFKGPSQAAVDALPNLATGPCPDTSRRVASARGSVILFVDVNENGQLDISETSVEDHVLASTTFPLELIGARHQGTAPPANASYGEACGAGRLNVEGKLLVFDDQRLDLTACNRADHFITATACGIDVFPRPSVEFTGVSTSTEALLGFKAADGVEIFVDDQLQGVATDGGLAVTSAALLEGTHQLRAEAAGKLPWEATLRMPQPLVILERPAAVSKSQDCGVVWSTQGGRPTFTLSFEQGRGRSSVETTGGVATVPVNVIVPGATATRFEVGARFPDFPGWTGVSFEVPLK